MDDKDKVVALMQQAFDAARLEIDHLRGATKMVEPAQPVAWLLAVGLTAGLAGGRAAHEQWERTRGDENECDAEKRLHEEVSESGNTIPIEWWHGWLERSDEWRDEIEHAG